MPSTIRPANNVFASDNNAYDLNGDTLIVDYGIVVASTNSYGVFGSGGETITCNGTIAGSTGAFTRGGGHLTIGSTGTVSGSYAGFADYVYGPSFVENHGMLFGGIFGAVLYAGDTLKNYGIVQAGRDTIDSGNAAIRLDFGTAATTIYNVGTIETKRANSYAILSAADSNSADTVTNAGLIKGYVALGNGNDVFDTARGKVYGTIDGGAGDDKITGSAYADRMKGGADADTFYFKSKPDGKAVDHIVDFEHLQDRIGLSKALFKLDPGQSVPSAFQDITAGLDKQGANKHILYNHDTGRLYYDKDGKGGAAPIHFATLDNDPTITSGDILMV